MATKYQQHVERWKNCIACSLCESRRQVVFTRDIVVADVVFIGEAPGPSENANGKPFIGPAGHELDNLIKIATQDNPTKYTIGFYNLVGCLPPRDPETKKLRDPTDEEVDACSPKLKEFLAIAKPRAVMLLGKLAQKTLLQSMHEVYPQIQTVASMIHPSAILQADISQKNLARQRCVVAIRDMLQELEDIRDINGSN